MESLRFWFPFKALLLLIVKYFSQVGPCQNISSRRIDLSDPLYRVQWGGGSNFLCCVRDTSLYHLIYNPSVAPTPGKTRPQGYFYTSLKSSSEIIPTQNDASALFQLQSNYGRYFTNNISSLTGMSLQV